MPSPWDDDTLSDIGPLPWDDPTADILGDIRRFADAARAAPSTPWTQFWLHCETCWAGSVWGSAVFALEYTRDRMAQAHAATGHVVRLETVG